MPFENKTNNENHDKMKMNRLSWDKVCASAAQMDKQPTSGVELGKSMVIKHHLQIKQMDKQPVKRKLPEPLSDGEEKHEQYEAAIEEVCAAFEKLALHQPDKYRGEMTDMIMCEYGDRAATGQHIPRYVYFPTKITDTIDKYF